MADKSSIIISYTDHSSGKAQQKTITDINPDASSAKLATWGEMTAALTKDNYVKTTRIDKTDCDDDTMTDRVITSIKSRDNRSGLAYHDIGDTGIINLTTAQVLEKQLMIVIKTPNDGACPVISDFNDTNTDNPISLVTTTWSSTMNTSTEQQNAWGIVFANGAIASARTDITARTVSFKLSFNKTNTYYGYERNITFNITAAE